MQGKYGVENRMEAVNKDHSHSWVRISRGLKKLVTDLSNKEDDDNEQETSEMKFEEFALKTNVFAFASRSKAKAKPRRRTSACSSTRTVPICDRFWTDVEPGTFSHIAYPVSKRLSTLLRHGHLPREEDGAIAGEWRNIFGTILHDLNIGLMKSGRVEWQEAEATRKDFNIVLVHQDKRFFISELFKDIQDAISLILHYTTMCQFRPIASSTFITSDVQSIYTPSQSQDRYREDKIWAKDRQYSVEKRKEERGKMLVEPV